MIVYYLQNKELGWHNVVSIATSPQKCIEDYTLLKKVVGEFQYPIEVCSTPLVLTIK